ncbi:fungal-specific transcription factor domain-containing protein [Leptodontidium sp. 2 PMI_412]|nr:fungal-specific transcription factor domain-containing protein [Leptodontidium sp. 2 PMI_412]
MTDVEPRVKRRAAKACELCRRRKMKCDNEEPRCTNCKASRTHVAQLQEENRRLQARLSVGPSNSASSNHETSSPSVLVNESVRVESTHPTDEPMGNELHRTSIVEPSLLAPNAHRNEAYSGQSSYYGRTSALFDEDSSDRRGVRVRGLASESTRRQLMGEAAHQRQLETLNYRSGKLDFDGITPEVGMHLLSLHWNRQHHSHLITYRPAFMRDMASKGPYFSKLLLNAIYFGSCKFSPREDVKGMHTQFRQRVRELLGGALDKSEITTIQAMLVMTNSLFALGDERSAAWIYAGIAFRMLIDLGAHLDSQTPKTTEEDLEIRRRVFWGAFVVDKIQSLYQGRPVSIQEADIRVPILFQDQYEELEEWQPFAYPETQRYHGSPAYSISTFTELCKLSVIMNAILTNVYGVKSAKRAPEQLAEDLENMHLDLKKWRDALPEHLVFDPLARGAAVPPPHVLSLHSMFNVLLILLHRPFVSEGHLHSTSRSIPANSFVVCAQAATRIVQLLRTYEKTFSIRHAPYLIAYATYVSATIHVRIAAQLGPGSEAYTCLRTCLNVFMKNQETNWAARRAQSVIVNLMKKMNIELAADEELTPAAAPPTSVDPSVSGNMEGQTTFSNPHTPHDSGLGRPESSSLPPPHDPIVDLDMDAIISSFIFAQQPQSYNQSDGFAPVFNKTNHEGVPLDHFDQRIDDGWNMLDFGVDGPFDDTLFGFNGPALDGMWQ